jgi:hypothetical protein
MNSVVICWGGIDGQSFLMLSLSDEQLQLVKRFHNEYIGNMEEPEGMLQFFYTEDNKFRFQKFEMPLICSEKTHVFLMGEL